MKWRRAKVEDGALVMQGAVSFPFPDPIFKRLDLVDAGKSNATSPGLSVNDVQRQDTIAIS